MKAHANSSAIAMIGADVAPATSAPAFGLCRDSYRPVIERSSARLQARETD
jgi:hypothetical protein